jgi:DNA-binding transcriptional LysR family regulator
MNGLTIQQLLCFDAVVTEEGFKAAADKLGRSHPTVFAAVRGLETQLGLSLFDRSGYRVTLTEAGRSIHTRARVLLSELTTLCNQAAQLSMGEESELSIVIGDLCPLSQVLDLLRRFFSGCSGTRLHLHFEAISGPWERLFDGDADLIIHHIDPSDSRLEFINLCEVRIVPVVASGFLKFPITRSISPEQMRPYVQCVIRDSARHSPPRDYHLIDGALSWTVSDQFMKKELILQGMGWGHMPTFLIERELRTRRLLSISGRYLPETSGQLTAARLRRSPHGPVANRLWRYIQEHAGEFEAAVDPDVKGAPRAVRKRHNLRSKAPL